MWCLTICGRDISKGGGIWNIFTCHRQEERTFWVEQGFRTQEEQGVDKASRTKLSTVPEFVDFTFIWVSAKSLKEEKGQSVLVWVEWVLLILQEKQFQVYEP